MFPITDHVSSSSVAQRRGGVGCKRASENEILCLSCSLPRPQSSLTSTVCHLKHNLLAKKWHPGINRTSARALHRPRGPQKRGEKTGSIAYVTKLITYLSYGTKIYGLQIDE